MSVQVQASFKKDQKHLDGLDHVRKDLIDAPLQPRIIVAVIDVASITHDVLDGSDTPKIRLRQVEVLDGGDAMKAVDMLNRQYQRRTGREDSQASLFDDWDPGAATADEAEQHRAAAIHDAPPVDDDPAGDDDQDDAEPADEGGDDEGGVPWVPDAPGTASADWEGAPGVEFSGEAGPEVEVPEGGEVKPRGRRRGGK